MPSSSGSGFSDKYAHVRARAKQEECFSASDSEPIDPFSGRRGRSDNGINGIGAEGGWQAFRRGACTLRRSGELHKSERQRVHAVAKTGWFGTVVEHMPQMGIAQATRNCSAGHVGGSIRALVDIFLRNRLPEAGPSGT